MPGGSVPLRFRRAVCFHPDARAALSSNSVGRRWQHALSYCGPHGQPHLMVTRAATVDADICVAAFGKSLDSGDFHLFSAPQSVARHSPSAAFRRWWSGLVRLLASGSRSIHTCGEVWDFFWSSRPSLASNSWRSHTCRGRGTKARDRVEDRRLAERAQYPAPAVGLPPWYRVATNGLLLRYSQVVAGAIRTGKWQLPRVFVDFNRQYVRSGHYGEVWDFFGPVHKADPQTFLQQYAR